MAAGIKQLQRWLWGSWLLLWVGFLPSSAWGFDTNFQDYLIGQRAIGMGGAFTAIANDPSAGFYNPAGYVGVGRLKVGVNLTVYGFEYRNAAAGLARDAGGASLERLEFVLFPSTAGVASQFGGKDSKGRPLWGGGISFLVPSRTQLRFRTGFSEILKGQQRQAALTLHRDGQVFLVGPSLARRFGPLSVGISAFYSHRAFSWLLSNNVTLATCDPADLRNCKGDQASGAISSVEGWTGSINFRLGMMLEVTDALHIGLMVSMSSIRLWGDGNFLSHRFSLNKDPNADNELLSFAESRGLQSNSPLPWEIRLGASWKPHQNVLIALDLSIYIPYEYELLSSSAILDLFQYPQTIKRQGTVNTHLGLEWMIRPRVPFRVGFFTNLSTAPDLPLLTKEAFLSKVHMFGGTTSIGFGFGSASFDLGISVSYGEGHFQRLRDFEYERTSIRNLYVYIYLSGATEFIGYSVNQLLNTVGKLPIVRQTINLPQGKSKSRDKPKETKGKKRGKTPPADKRSPPTP